MSGLVFEDSNGNEIEIAADAGRVIDAANQDNVEAALDELKSGRRDNRRSLIRAGYLLTGLLRAVGGKSALQKRLKPIGLGSGEINKLIAISNTPELTDTEYDRSLPNDLETLYVLAGRSKHIRRLAELSVLSADLTGAGIRKICSHLDAVDPVLVDRSYVAQLKKADWSLGSNEPKPAYKIPKEMAAVSPKSVVRKGKRVLQVSVDLDEMGVSSVAELESKLSGIVKGLSPIKGLSVDTLFDSKKAEKWFVKKSVKARVDVKKLADDANALVATISKSLPAGDAQDVAVKAIIKDALTGAQAYELLEDHKDHPLHKVISRLKMDENAKGEAGRFYKKPKSKVPSSTPGQSANIALVMDAMKKQADAEPFANDPDPADRVVGG